LSDFGSALTEQESADRKGVNFNGNQESSDKEKSSKEDRKKEIISLFTLRNHIYRLEKKFSSPSFCGPLKYETLFQGENSS
jgi:hypothetical protein